MDHQCLFCGEYECYCFQPENDVSALCCEKCAAECAAYKNKNEWILNKLDNHYKKLSDSLMATMSLLLDSKDKFGDDCGEFAGRLYDYGGSIGNDWAKLREAIKAKT